MTGRTTPDNIGHVRGTDRTDNTPFKGVSVRCPVRPSVRPTQKQIAESRQALASMFGARSKRLGLTPHPAAESEGTALSKQVDGTAISEAVSVSYPLAGGCK